MIVLRATFYFPMNANLKNLFLVVLLGLCAWLLQQKSCGPFKTVAGAKEVRYDTVTTWVYDRDLQVVYKRDTIHDYITIRQFEPLIDTPYIMLTMALENVDSLHIYQGHCIGQDSSCHYDYTIGVQGDSVYFLTIGSKCQRPTAMVNVPEIVQEVNFKGLRAGFKVGVGAGPVYGLQFGYDHIYIAADYLPRYKSFMLEGGMMFPIGKKKIKAAGQKVQVSWDPTGNKTPLKAE